MRNKSPETSKTRQQIERLTKEISYHSSRILKSNNITKGTIYKQKKKCGNSNCKCAKGDLHSSEVLSFNLSGKTRLIPLTKYSILELMEMRKRVREYQKFRHNRAMAVSYFKKLIMAVNKLEKSLLIEVTPKKGEI